MGENKSNPDRDLRRLWRILCYLLRYRLIVLAGMAVTILFGASETLVPWMMYLLLDPESVAQWVEPARMHVVLPVLLVLLFVLRGLLGFTRTYWREWLHHTMARDLRRDMVGKLVRLPRSYHDREVSGILLSRLTHFTDQMLSTSLNVLVNLLQDTARLAGYLVTMFIVEWRFALVAVAALPITAVTINLITKRVRRHAGRYAVNVQELTGSLSDTIQGQVIVKTFGGQQREQERLERDMSRLRGTALRQAVALALNLPLSQLFIALALALILGLLAAALSGGTMRAGEVSTFIFAMVLLPLPLRNLARLAEQVQFSLAAAAQVFELIDSEQEATGGTHAPTRIQGAIEFAGVSFAYPAGEANPALVDIDLAIRPGEKVALVGPSGGGKSTLANLLLCFYRPQAGTIKIDGVDVRDWSLPALRAGIGVVTQDVLLFNASVAENVAYPHTGAAIDQARLDQALAASQSDGIVAAMADGTATVLGERGLRLSGGERQRISIARAFYKDAPILILDEATSALDARTEEAVRTALERLLKDRTVLIIAHRLVTVEMAERIVVLDGGRVSATGTHAELMVANPLYRGLHEAQKLAGQ